MFLLYYFLPPRVTRAALASLGFGVCSEFSARSKTRETKVKTAGARCRWPVHKNTARPISYIVMHLNLLACRHRTAYLHTRLTSTRAARRGSTTPATPAWTPAGGATREPPRARTRPKSFPQRHLVMTSHDIAHWNLVLHKVNTVPTASRTRRSASETNWRYDAA